MKDGTLDTENLEPDGEEVEAPDEDLEGPKPSFEFKKDEMSALELKRAIQMNHPTDNGKPFDSKADVGEYKPLIPPEITPVVQEIGIGPSMYLLQAKSMFIVFFFLIILNIPGFIYLGAANESEVKNLADFFMLMSLGSLGQAMTSCLEVNWANSMDFSFSCGSAKAELTELRFIGMTFDDQTECKML